MRLFFIKLSLIVLPIGLAVAAVNYFVDPANLFTGSAYVDRVARILSAGHNVDNLTNYDERIFQEQMIKDVHKTPDVVVLGSSRIMEIGSNFFPGKTVLNCGVSHGNVNDLVAIVGALDSLGRLPHEMVIGVDPHLIGQGGTSEWEQLHPYYDCLIKKLLTLYPDADAKPSANPFHRLLPLFSFSYFRSSMEFLIKRKSKKYTDVGLNRPTNTGRLSDGTISYGWEYTHPDRNKVANDAEITGADQGLPLPDTAKIRLFESLLTFLQGKKVELHFVMIPFHPDFYKGIRQEHGSVLQAWQPVFATIAASYHIPLSGNFDANILGMPVADFYDMYHCSGESIKKYIQIQ
jgi:hypothetical protein